MSAVPYKVYVVVDREFGEQLADLDPGVPVWIVDTVTNKAVVHRLWGERSNSGHLTGITIFHDGESSSPEDLLLGELETIDLHHGSYSASPPYTVLEVVGTALNPKAKKKLSEYGFNEFSTSPVGFIASRPKPQN
jgi:hypothetical protein